jgi:hypothetical protein
MFSRTINQTYTFLTQNDRPYNPDWIKTVTFFQNLTQYNPKLVI